MLQPSRLEPGVQHAEDPVPADEGVRQVRLQDHPGGDLSRD